MEEMLERESMESLKELKVQGISQFERELEHTRDLDTERRICDMNKLFSNPLTGEKGSALQIEADETLLEHCSPRLLF